MCTKEPKCELDYYCILNVPRDASLEQITLAYRRLAVHCNPHREEQYDKDFIPHSWTGDICHLKCMKREKQWAYINMAYHVLSHPLRREIYDRFGEAGLLHGVPLPNGYFPPYEYHGDHLKVYHSVFGSYSPFANIIDIVTNPPPIYSTKDGHGVKIKCCPIQKVICLDLKEIFFGTMKRMKILRQEYIDDLKTVTDTREKTLLVNIPPGTLPGTKFVFPNEGDRCPTTIPSDIVFITADKPHHAYVRQCNDLIYTHPISLCEALVGFKFHVQTIDERKLVILITDVVHHTFEKVIIGEGLPKLAVEGEEPQKGDLIIRFNITYPVSVPRYLKCKVKVLFDEIHVENNRYSEIVLTNCSPFEDTSSPKKSTDNETDILQKSEFQSILGRIATLGHNTEYAKGPDDNLLLADYVTWNSANPDISLGRKNIAIGPDANILTERSYTANGRNPELCKGSIYSQLSSTTNTNIKCN